MRTMLDLDDDVLLLVKEIARRRGVSVGKALSDLVRQALLRQESETTRNGVPLFPIGPESRLVTLEFVNRLRDDELPSSTAPNS